MPHPFKTQEDFDAVKIPMRQAFARLKGSWEALNKDNFCDVDVKVVCVWAWGALNSLQNARHNLMYVTTGIPEKDFYFIHDEDTYPVIEHIRERISLLGQSENNEVRIDELNRVLRWLGALEGSVIDNIIVCSLEFCVIMLSNKSRGTHHGNHRISQSKHRATNAVGRWLRCTA